MISNAAAWITGPKSHPFVVKEAHYVSPGPREVVIENSAVAMNPADHKIQDYDSLPNMKYPTILGCDIAGTVVEVGEQVEGLMVGHRVIGHSVGLFIGQPKASGFQKFTVLSSTLVTPIPDHISFEKGVVLPLACDTAAAGLFQENRLALSLPSGSTTSLGKVLLVWGGSSSVGCCVIQLARAAGCEVIATASPKNHDVCYSLGASQIFDYRSESVVEEIVASLKTKTLIGAFDCVADSTTTKACAEVLEKVQGKGLVVSVLQPPEDVLLPEGVQAQRLQIPEFFQTPLPTAFHAWLAKALREGTMLPKPDPFVAGHGLEAIQGALDTLKRGVSASKVVVTL